MTRDHRDPGRLGSQRGAPGGATNTGTRRQARADGGFDADFSEVVLERVGVGVAVYDESGRFKYVNDAYADLLNRSREDVLGDGIWTVNPEFERERFEAYWESFAVGETRKRETLHRGADGEAFPVETHTTAIERDGTRYHVGTITDITQRVEQLRQVRRQDQRLEQFASVVSHDLRNPLNVAMGRLELAREECDSDHLEPVESSLDRMESLIADVLTLAREGSRLTETEAVSLRRAISTAWAALDTADADLDVVDDLGTVASKESRICELFENLFRNAVEHGGDGVTVTVGELAGNDGFYVADDGPGVPDEDRDQVFEYGYSTTDEGTGFGLAIVKGICEAHGWEVLVTESETGGARFEVRGVQFE